MVIALFAMVTDNTLFIAEKVKYVTSDKLNQIYVLSFDNTIAKYDGKGKNLISRNLKIEGDVTSIDGQNVFNLMLFYQNINTLVFTDNLLNVRSKIDFNATEELADKQISAVCRSFDNNIWVFDIISQKLIKIDESAKPILESPSITAFTKLQHNPQQIIEMPPHVYLMDSTQVIALSIYGQFEKVMHSKSKLNSASIRKDSLWFTSNKTLYLLPKMLDNDSLIPYKSIAPNENIKFFEGGKLLLKADSLFLQSF